VAFYLGTLRGGKDYGESLFAQRIMRLISTQRMWQLNCKMCWQKAYEKEFFSHDRIGMRSCERSTCRTCFTHKWSYGGRMSRFGYVITLSHVNVNVNLGLHNVCASVTGITWD
jgi:hypothetical protein